MALLSKYHGYLGLTEIAPGSNTYVPDTNSVGIGTITPNAAAVLHLASNVKGVFKGFLPPVVDDPSARILTPVEGLMVYSTTNSTLAVYTTLGWKYISLNAELVVEDEDSRLKEYQNLKNHAAVKVVM